jgi:hypothetical protein
VGTVMEDEAGVSGFIAMGICTSWLNIERQSREFYLKQPFEGASKREIASWACCWMLNFAFFYDVG